MPSFIRWPLKVLFMALIVGSIGYTASLLPPMVRVVKKHGLMNPVVFKGVIGVSILVVGSIFAGVALYAIIRAEIEERRRRLRLPTA